MNKRLMLLSISILALGLTVGSSLAWSKSMNSTASEFRSSKIIGMEVKDQQGRKVGWITLSQRDSEPIYVVNMSLDKLTILERLFPDVTGAVGSDGRIRK